MSLGDCWRTIFGLSGFFLPCSPSSGWIESVMNFLQRLIIEKFEHVQEHHKSKERSIMGLTRRFTPSGPSWSCSHPVRFGFACLLTSPVRLVSFRTAHHNQLRETSWVCLMSSFTKATNSVLNTRRGLVSRRRSSYEQGDRQNHFTSKSV